MVPQTSRFVSVNKGALRYWGSPEGTEGVCPVKLVMAPLLVAAQPEILPLGWGSSGLTTGTTHCWNPGLGVEVILSQAHNLNPVVTMTPKVDTNSGKFCLLRSSMLLNEHLPEILPVKHASPNYEGCRGAARLSLQHMRPSGYQPQLPAVHTSSNCLLWFVFLSPRLAFMVPPINLP